MILNQSTIHKGVVSNFDEQIALSDLVKAVIFLKSGSLYFKEEALVYGFRKASRTEQALEGLFSTGSDGTPERRTALEDTLGFLQVARALRYTSDWQRLYLTSSGRKTIQRQLIDYYGDSIFERVRPLAEDVWKYSLE